MSGYISLSKLAFSYKYGDSLNVLSQRIPRTEGDWQATVSKVTRRRTRLKKPQLAHACTHTHTHTRTRAHTHKHAHTHTHMHTHTQPSSIIFHLATLS